MKIGVPKEIKSQEYRVGMTPASVKEVIAAGHEVVVQSNAGIGIGATDEMYRFSGARIVDSAEEVFASSEMIVKVKEPQASERKLLRPDHILFTYLHLAPDPEQTRELVASGATCIAYETITDRTGGLPLLAPMSEVAGRLSVQAGAHHLEKAHGGAGTLLGGVTGVAPAKVVIIGGGVVGRNAITIAMGMGADVWVLDRNQNVLRSLESQFGTSLKTIYSTTLAIELHCSNADLVIGGVLIPGAAAPRLISKEVIRSMKPGSVIVDVAIDQGGCTANSRPTTHQDPVFIEDGVVHYCVANMPGAVPKTSTYALNNCTLPFTLELANYGWKAAIARNPHLAEGVNVCNGKVTYRSVAESLGYEYVPALEA